jgi:hypothetical protein
MMAIVGHHCALYAVQIFRSASLTTGCFSSYRSTALRMASVSFSLSNFGRVNADHDELVLVLLLQLRQFGMMCMQLMQQSVQKSRITILPRSSLSVSGLPVLIQATPPSSSGAGTGWIGDSQVGRMRVLPGGA